MNLLSKIYIPIFSLIISFLLLSSCSNSVDELDVSITSNLKCTIEEISENQLPEGVTPLVLKDKNELYALLNKIDSLQLKVVSSPNHLPRLKAFSETGSTSTTAYLSSGNDYQITITFAWKEWGDITVDSHNTSTWYFSSWTQNTGVASWGGKSRIDYDITGTIKFYVIVSWQFFEIDRQDMTVSGYVKG